ncbi:MAG: hypothetical protein GX219_08820 [Tissierellia bacterium]|nr:hypothetical protein [Tissierellia bacterium]
MYKKNNRNKIIIISLLSIIGIGVSVLLKKFELDIKMFLPLEIFIVLAACFVPAKIVAIYAIVASLIASLVFQAPEFFNDGLFLMFQCLAGAVTVSILYRTIELPPIISLLFGIMAGRLTICIVAFLMALLAGFDQNPISFALQMTVIGLPGVIGQLFIVPLSIYAITKYTTLGIE